MKTGDHNDNLPADGEGGFDVATTPATKKGRRKSLLLCKKKVGSPTISPAKTPQINPHRSQQPLRAAPQQSESRRQRNRTSPAKKTNIQKKGLNYKSSKPGGKCVDPTDQHHTEVLQDMVNVVKGAVSADKNKKGTSYNEQWCEVICTRLYRMEERVRINTYFID